MVEYQLRGRDITGERFYIFHKLFQQFWHQYACQSICEELMRQKKSLGYEAVRELKHGLFLLFKGRIVEKYSN